MTAACFTIRDVAFSIGQFLPLKDCAPYGAVSRAYRQLAITFGFPQFTHLSLDPGDLLPFSQSRWKFKNLAILTIKGMSQETVIPASFNRPSINELRVSFAYGNQRKIKELIHAVDQLYVLRIKDESSRFIMKERFLGAEEREKLSQLRTLEVQSGHSIAVPEPFLDLIEPSPHLTRVLISTYSASVLRAVEPHIAQKTQMREVILDCAYLEPGDPSPLRQCRNITKFAPPAYMSLEDVIFILESNRETLTHLSLMSMALNEAEFNRIISILATLSKLQFLALPQISITVSLQPLSKLPLIHLSLVDINIPDPEHLIEIGAFVEALPRVRSLSIEGCEDGYVYSCLRAHMPDLRELYSGVTLTADIAVEIAQLSNLEILVLDDLEGGCEPNILFIVDRCPNLTTLVCWPFNDYAILDRLHDLTQRREKPLHFSAHSFGDDPDPVLIEWRKHHPDYTKLILNGVDYSLLKTWRTEFSVQV
jgi:hypothetical protein